MTDEPPAQGPGTRYECPFDSCEWHLFVPEPKVDNAGNLLVVKGPSRIEMPKLGAGGPEAYIHDVSASMTRAVMEFTEERLREHLDAEHDGWTEEGLRAMFEQRAKREAAASVTPEMVAAMLAMLLHAGYLSQAGRRIPAGPGGAMVEVSLQDEFVVTHPDGGEGRPLVLELLRQEMGW